ncbi:hypothetical protein NMY22_g14960 [Coprinellus aureogranulatus]|nr:hypothetical protein NMY22_g14960 [Coprinellus aureogranulatus]
MHQHSSFLHKSEYIREDGVPVTVTEIRGNFSGIFNDPIGEGSVIYTSSNNGRPQVNFPTHGGKIVCDNGDGTRTIIGGPMGDASSGHSAERVLRGTPSFRQARPRFAEDHEIARQAAAQKCSPVDPPSAADSPILEPVGGSLAPILLPDLQNGHIFDVPGRSPSDSDSMYLPEEPLSNSPFQAETTEAPELCSGRELECEQEEGHLGEGSAALPLDEEGTGQLQARDGGLVNDCEVLLETSTLDSVSVDKDFDEATPKDLEGFP